MLYYDSHCHYLAIDSTSENILSIIPSIQLNDITLLSNLDRDKYQYAVGLHPWHIDDVDIDKYADLLERHILQYSPDAIGEVGLDKLRPSYDKQCILFEISCKLANKYNLPLIIHCVKSYSEISYYLTKYKNKGIVHAFNQNTIIANELISKGMLLGIGSLIYKSKLLQDTIKNIDTKYLLLESDAPYMVDSSLAVREISKTISDIKDCSELNYLNSSYNSLKSLLNKCKSHKL